MLPRQAFATLDQQIETKFRLNVTMLNKTKGMSKCWIIHYNDNVACVGKGNCNGPWTQCKSNTAAAMMVVI